MLLAALAGASLAAGAEGHVGSSVCRGCHASVWSQFFRNPHYKTLVSESYSPESAGCEGCHGPGKAHVESMGEVKLLSFGRAEPGEVLDTCLRCHDKTVSRANIRRSQHTLSGVVCSNCHSIHQPDSARTLLAKRQEEVCYNCHAPIRAQFNMPSKHRVHEGLIQCSDCHNPHGAAAPTWRMGVRPRMTSQALGNEQTCLGCHPAQRGPFVFEHAAVRVGGCEVCHQPHGSTNPRLLRRPAVYTICLECHSGAGSFGRRVDGIQRTAPSHNMADPRFHNCTACHVRIHGSNGDPLFLR